MYLDIVIALTVLWPLDCLEYSCLCSALLLAHPLLHDGLPKWCSVFHNRTTYAFLEIYCTYLQPIVHQLWPNLFRNKFTIVLQPLPLTLSAPAADQDIISFAIPFLNSSSGLASSIFSFNNSAQTRWSKLAILSACWLITASWFDAGMTGWRNWEVHRIIASFRSDGWG